MRNKFLSFTILIAFVFSSNAFSQSSTKAKSPARLAAEKITAEQMSDYLHFIASDEMEGRDTPSRGLDTVAKFIALNLKRWGFKPAGDNGTYFQTMITSRNVADSQSAEVNGTKLVYGEDFLAAPVASSVNAPLVFGGNGWLVKAKGIDSLQGIDVKGKIVLFYTDGLPRGVTFQDFRGKRGEDWADPGTNARIKGAVGMIAIGAKPGEVEWSRARSQTERGGLTIEKLRETKASQSIPTIMISRKVAESLFAGETGNPLTNPEQKAFEFASPKSASFSVTIKPERIPTQNVVAIWEGSDPVLKNEMVAIGAHYDHVGINPDAKGDDKIWNGADDDGSGTTAVLSIAEALAQTKIRPKRSILLVWHCGEEKGLWGSEYFNKFPTVNIKNVVAQLNIDMIGRSKKPGYLAPCDTNLKPGQKPCNEELSDENSIYVIGSQMMSSTLGNVTNSVNNSYLKLKYDVRYDDPKDTNRFFFRSDHFNYAMNGIPIVFWFDGVHEDYHQPGDEADKIDYLKMEKVTRTIFLTLWEVAGLKTRPAIDKELPPELKQR